MRSSVIGVWWQSFTYSPAKMQTTFLRKKSGFKFNADINHHSANLLKALVETIYYSAAAHLRFIDIEFEYYVSDSWLVSCSCHFCRRNRRGLHSSSSSSPFRPMRSNQSVSDEGTTDSIYVSKSKSIYMYSSL